jgi:hypothetical protein
MSLFLINELFVHVIFNSNPSKDKLKLSQPFKRLCINIAHQKIGGTFCWKSTLTTMNKCNFWHKEDGEQFINSSYMVSLNLNQNFCSWTLYKFITLPPLFIIDNNEL